MLAHFITAQIFAFLLLFCRIGSGILAMPGFGETYVSPRIRLVFALMLSLILTPLLGKTLPSLPPSALSLALLILSEILIGLFIGSVCQIIISVTHIAGMIFALQSGISSAVIFDASQSSQGSLIGNFFGIVTILLIFCTDLHYLMLRGITESYTVFTPGKFPPVNDFVSTIAHLVSDTFTMAVQISTPVIIAGTLLFLGGGILSRLMPTIQIFFVIIAPQLLLGFFILMTTFTGLMLFYMEFYKDKIMAIMSYIK